MLPARTLCTKGGAHLSPTHCRAAPLCDRYSRPLVVWRCSRGCIAVHRLLVLLLTVRPNVSAVSNRFSASPVPWHSGLPAVTEEKGKGL